MSQPAGHLEPALLAAYHENALDASERAAVEAHLERCGACRAELALAREVTSVPVGASMGQRSEDLKSTFAARLRERPETRTDSKPVSSEKVVPFRPRRSLWLAGGLLAASLAVFAIGIYQLREPSVPADLGATVRRGTVEAPLSLEVRKTASGGWELECQVDSKLKNPRVVITTASGKVALEREFTGDHFSFTPDELSTQGTDSTLFAQIVAVDALGNHLRSKPERLTR